jgi:hypothetical protein
MFSDDDFVCEKQGLEDHSLISKFDLTLRPIKDFL